jgi:hypothetical protein
MADLEKCRSCHKPVRFVQTLNAKMVPIDPDPADNGTIFIDHDGRARFATCKRRQCRSCGCIEAVACRTGRTNLLGEPEGCHWIEGDLCSECKDRPALRYVSHFATCPQSAAWRDGGDADRVARVREAVEKSIERNETDIEYQLRKDRR